MIKDSFLYKNYFAKDKPFRHIWQHFLVASAAFMLMINILPLEINKNTILLFLLFTYLPDLDGFMYVLRNRKDRQVGTIVKLITKLQFLKAMKQATIVHKKFTGLIIHNIYGLWGIAILICFSIYSHNTVLLFCATAILAHFMFDISDDMYQMGHIRNWLR